MKNELLKNQINKLPEQDIDLDVNETKKLTCIFPLIK